MAISHNSLLYATLAIYPLSQKYLITITQGFEDKGWVLLCCWLSWKVVSLLIHKMERTLLTGAARKDDYSEVP